MVLLLLQISLPLLWLRSCNKDFYEDFENPNIVFEVNEHKDYNILKRYSLIRKDNLRSPSDRGHYNFLNVAPCLRHQSEKISLNSNTENRIFGTDNRFSAFNIVTYPRKKYKTFIICVGRCTKAPYVLVLELARLIGLLSSTAQAVLVSAAVSDSNFIATIRVTK